MLCGAKELTLHNENGDPAKLADDIEATDLAPDIHILPGLWRIDGYTRLVSAIEQTFDTVKAYPRQDKLANLIIFPYDWRRDNRINAKRLASTANEFLARWRNQTYFKNAKVIILAHSMGGLISRYYLDVLGGWENCRALFTFGTPYRGSLNALETLANGVRKVRGLIDLSDALRSMPAVYQLLPRYPCVLHEKAYHRVSAINALPNVVQQRAHDALNFHLEVDKAVGDRGGVLGYGLFPYVGIHQTTQQSAESGAGGLRVRDLNPPELGNAYEDGDGTVPLVSAIPLELADRAELVNYFTERHSSLQVNGPLLNDLMQRLIGMEAPGTSQIRGGASKGLAMMLDVDDAYVAGEPVKLQVKVKDSASDVTISGSIEDRARNVTAPIEFAAVDQHWEAAIQGLGSGTYRVEVKANSTEGTGAVHDVFAMTE